MIYSTVPYRGAFSKVVDVINDNFAKTSQMQTFMESLTAAIREDQALIRQAVGAIDVDDFEPVFGPRPSVGEYGKIYFVPGQGDTYTEEAWNGTEFVVLATRQGNIVLDEVPTPGSARMVKSGGIAGTYGSYEDLASELVWCICDMLGRPAVGLKKDGTIWYGFDLPQQIKDAIDDLNARKYEIVEGKDIIDAEFASNVESVEAGIWLYAWADQNDKVICGIRTDGSFYAQQMSGPVIAQLRTELGEPPRQVKKSTYVDYSDGDALTLDTPQMTGAVNSSKVMSVSTESALMSALSGINANTIIRLTSDIALTSALTISNKSYEITIDGQGHKIYPLGTEYSRSGYEGGMGYCAYSDSYSPSERFLDANGNALEWNWSKYYQAAGRVTDSSGNNLNWQSYSAMDCRLQLPGELQSLSIPEGNSMWINISTWFVSMEWKVIKTQTVNGVNYLYFRFGGHSYGIDGDYYFLQRFPTFRLFNTGKRSTGVCINNSKLYFPSNLEKVYKAGGFNLLTITDCSKVLLTNIVFEGSASLYDVLANKSVVLFEHCEFEHKMSNYSIGVEGTSSKQGEIYVNDCYFHDLYGGGIAADIQHSGQYSKTKVTNCHFKDCGQNRNNFGNIYCNGTYHIENNLIEDYGYCGIYVGIIQTTDATLRPQGVVQHNILRQTEEYDIKRTIMDSGAIYVATNNIMSVVRYNKVINYRGLGNNIGIFLDDDAYNVQVYSNIIENNPNAYAISARLADLSRPHPSSSTLNTNKVIAQNICDSPIELAGRNDVDNNVFLGTNIILNSEGASVRNIEGQEDQILSPLSQLVNGELHSRIQTYNWNI